MKARAKAHKAAPLIPALKDGAMEMENWFFERCNFIMAEVKNFLIILA